MTKSVQQKDNKAKSSVDGVITPGLNPSGHGRKSHGDSTLKFDLQKGDKILRNGTWYDFEDYGSEPRHEGKREVLAVDKKSGYHTHFLETHWDCVFRKPYFYEST